MSDETRVIQDDLEDHRRNSLLRLQSKVAILQDRVQTLITAAAALRCEVEELSGDVSAVVDAATVNVAYNGMKIDELQKREEDKAG